MFVKCLIYTAAEWRQGRRPFNNPIRHYESDQKIPESLAGYRKDIPNSPYIKHYEIRNFSLDFQTF